MASNCFPRVLCECVVLVCLPKGGVAVAKVVCEAVDGVDEDGACGKFFLGGDCWVGERESVEVDVVWVCEAKDLFGEFLSALACGVVFDFVFRTNFSAQ